MKRVVVLTTTTLLAFLGPQSLQLVASKAT